MRLLEYKPNGDYALREFTSENVPPYAILPHTWGDGEVSLQELETGIDKDKAG